MKRIVTIIVALVLLAAAQSVAQLAADPTQRIEGTINVAWTDPVPGGTAGPGVIYTLVEDSGIRWQLNFTGGIPRDLATPSELMGSRFRVVGRESPGREATMVVSDVVRLDERDPPLPILGPQPYIWVLLRFSDDPDEPEGRTFFLIQGTGGFYPTLTHYWNAVSYGNVNLDGSSVTAWIELPHPRSYYVYDMDPDEEGDEFDAGRAFDDAAVVADPYVDFTQYKGINLCFNGYLAGYALGGWATKTLDGETRDWPLTWLGRGGWMTISIVAHEMGHSFTMPHSSGPYTEIYDSHWDVMSENCGECTISDPTYLNVPIGPIAWQRNKVGWIHSNHRYEMPTSPTVAAIYLNDLNYAPPLGRMLMGVIYTSYPTHYYTLERRRFTAYDGALPDETMIIHHINLYRDNPAQVQDASYDYDPNDEGARWDLGETYYNATYSTVVHVQETDASGSLVVMSNNARGLTYVDPGNTGYEDGSDISPWDTMFEGYGGVAPQGTVRVEPGTYNGSFTFNKPLTLQRWGASGEVVIVGGS